MIKFELEALATIFIPKFHLLISDRNHDSYIEIHENASLLDLPALCLLNKVAYVFLDPVFAGKYQIAMGDGRLIWEAERHHFIWKWEMFGWYPMREENVMREISVFKRQWAKEDHGYEHLELAITEVKEEIEARREEGYEHEEEL